MNCDSCGKERSMLILTVDAGGVAARCKSCVVLRSDEEAERDV